jgi:hypothetical protein
MFTQEDEESHINLVQKYSNKILIHDNVFLNSCRILYPYFKSALALYIPVVTIALAINNLAFHTECIYGFPSEGKYRLFSLTRLSSWMF